MKLQACVILIGLANLARGASIQTPFSLDLSQLGGSSAVFGTTIASGLNFPYGITAGPSGSLFFAQSTPTSSVGLEYGAAPDTTGAVWQLQASGSGFGSPQPVVGGLTGLLTSVQTLANGALLVDSGAGDAGTRAMSFFSTTGQSLGAINFSYPAGSAGNWEHSNGMSLVVPNANGTNTVYFIVGSQYDGAATAGKVSLSGLVSTTLNADSVYMMTVGTAGGLVQVDGAPVQVATGLRNPFGLTLDANGDLVIGDNGIDGAHAVDELSADALHAIPASQIGQQVFDFGFPGSYTLFGNGAYVNGDPGATPPLAVFTPMPDENGALQKSEGLSALAYVAPGAMPFVGTEGGEFISFHGVFDAGGAANYDNAVLYYDFASGGITPIVDAGNPAIGHIDGLLVEGSSLYMEEFSATGEVNGLSGLGGGDIYDFNLSYAAPEPGTFWLALACLALLAGGATASSRPTGWFARRRHPCRRCPRRA